MRQETCYYNLKKKFQRRRRRKKKKTRCTAIAVSTCRVRGGQREVPGGTFFLKLFRQLESYKPSLFFPSPFFFLPSFLHSTGFFKMYKQQLSQVTCGLATQSLRSRRTVGFEKNKKQKTFLLALFVFVRVFLCNHMEI